MARPMSKAAIARRTAKAKATREAKKKAALKNLGIDAERKKIRKPRKPMTPEQKEKARKALEKARAARGPSKNSNYAEEVRILPDDDPLSLKNVKQWIKTQKEIFASMKSFKDSKDAKERDQYNDTHAYITNLEFYLRHGVYVDHRAGEHKEKKIQQRCVKMAYYPDGTPKRTAGIYYPDLGKVYEEDNGNTVSKQKQILKTGRKRRTRKKA